jgi:hypothetical protein
MQDQSTQQEGVLLTRQQKKLKKSKTSDVSFSLQDMMQSQQPDEIGSGAPSGAGASHQRHSRDQDSQKRTVAVGDADACNNGTH